MARTGILKDTPDRLCFSQWLLGRKAQGFQGHHLRINDQPVEVFLELIVLKEAKDVA